MLKVTSGTTSEPRAIRFTAAQLLADYENICKTMGLRESDLNYGVASFAHSYGFSNLITPLLCDGMALVVSSDLIPRAIVEGIRSTSATVFPGSACTLSKPGRVFCFTEEASSLHLGGRTAAGDGCKRLLRNAGVARFIPCTALQSAEVFAMIEPTRLRFRRTM